MCIILVSINTLDTTTKKQIKYIKNKTFIISAKLAFLSAGKTNISNNWFTFYY